MRLWAILAAVVAVFGVIFLITRGPACEHLHTTEGRRIDRVYVPDGRVAGRDVAGFYLGRTEVTNGQFLAFVRETGARPPASWASNDSFRAANRPSNDSLLGLSSDGQHGLNNDQMEWWKEHWQDAEWCVPLGEASEPVRYIDYEHARAFAKWAGGRLMTWFEHRLIAESATPGIRDLGLSEWTSSFLPSSPDGRIVVDASTAPYDPYELTDPPLVVRAKSDSGVMQGFRVAFDAPE